MASYTHQIPDDSEMVSIGTPSDDDLSENENNPDTESQPSSRVTFNLGGSCYSRSSTSSLRARKLDLERRIYESFEDALIKMRGWASISDSPYMVAREL